MIYFSAINFIDNCHFYVHTFIHTVVQSINSFTQSVTSYLAISMRSKNSKQLTLHGASSRQSKLHIAIYGKCLVGSCVVLSSKTTGGKNLHTLYSCNNPQFWPKWKELIISFSKKHEQAIWQAIWFPSVDCRKKIIWPPGTFSPLWQHPVLNKTIDSEYAREGKSECPPHYSLKRLTHGNGPFPNFKYLRVQRTHISVGKSLKGQLPFSCVITGRPRCIHRHCSLHPSQYLKKSVFVPLAECKKKMISLVHSESQ